MEHWMKEVQQRIDKLLAEKDQVLVAIDGCCTAGKTTLAARLEQEYDCNLIHMDDFFLQPEQRTPERLAEAGGNVDYERFYKEVLRPLKAGEPVSPRLYDCSIRRLVDGKTLTPKKLTIVEGTYSHHPYFGTPYDLKIFITVDPQVQRHRVMQRSGYLHRRFFEEWIPMEQRYFEAFRLEEQADLVLK